MSIEAINWALNQVSIPPEATPNPSRLRFVLIALANHAAPDGRNAFPSIATIERYTQLSSRSIQRAIGELIELGFVTRGAERVRDATIERRDRRPNCYDLVMSTGCHPDTPSGSTGCQESVHGVSGERPRGVTVTPEPKEEPKDKPTTAHAHARESEKFQEFWQAYPDRGGLSRNRDDAWRAWCAVVKALSSPDSTGDTWTIEQVVDGARRYAKECQSKRGPERQYVKSPGPWLRAGGWKYEQPGQVHDPRAWLQRQWQLGEVSEIHERYRAGYSTPELGYSGDSWEVIRVRHNRAWIENHRGRILERFGLVTA